MLTKRQLEDMSNNSVSWNLKDAAQTALAYRKMLERYEEEWRTGYEINFGTKEIPETETEYWELVSVLNGLEG